MMKKDPTASNHITTDEEQKHSMVCNDQLFFQELRIAAEDAERDDDNEEIQS
ncbi:TPA: hypothetical protein G9C53_005006 [Salmonella enterica subsp. enterica serovar Typhimurium var. 5-]|uniref:Uncharacterized protein n=1 Tax=Salmonella enterica subsp. enterica serovar Typhimurium var. 5- TaxID=1620419 RepID=A0A740Q0K9_SALTM|nr:hypothetical protein [Salmonella enterica subsp. enterica serovar Typhimurium var. 5-]